MSGSGERRFEYFVRGRVQGVAFRAHTRDAAIELGLAGFVENLADGRVHGQVEGSETQLTEFRRFLGHGSRWARVDEVEWLEVERLAGEPGESGALPREFTIRR
ncbi:MAG: acylphosphatase [Planctomycetota bacterium]